MKLAWGTFWVILALDQATKWIVVQGMGLHQRLVIDVWPPFLTFRMAWNQGVNFGLFAHDAAAMRWILVAVAVAISIWVWLWAWREPENRLMQLSAGLLVGGAMGNVVDRLYYGAVADFINLTCCGLNNPYAFNIADIAVFAGAVGLVLFAGRQKTP